MEYENPTGGGKKTQRLNSDIINSLPHNIIESILSRMPIRDAVRTSVLSKKWQYCWQSMPKLEFTDDMVKLLPSKSGYTRLMKYKLATAIFHVLLSHNGPEILELNCPVSHHHLGSEFAKIISYLARGDKLKQLIFLNDGDDSGSYKLPASFFSLQGLEHIDLLNCTFEPPLTFNGFGRLKTMIFENIKVSAQTLQRFLSKCSLLEHICLGGCLENYDFTAAGNKFTFVDLLQCVPLIKTLCVSGYYVKYLSADGMPHTLPTSLVHLKDLFLNVCLMEQNEFSSVLCIIRSSPMLEKITLLMHGNETLPVQQTPTNYLDLDLEGHPNLKLDHLVILEIKMIRSNSPLVMEFVKLIMAKSPMLKKVLIQFHCTVSDYEELRMLRDMLLLSFPRASPSAKLIIERPSKL